MKGIRNIDLVIEYLKEFKPVYKEYKVSLNVDRFKEVEKHVVTIANAVRAVDSEATYNVKKGEFQNGSVVLVISAKKFDFESSPKLREAFANASNFGIDPLVNKRVEIDISFDGVYNYEPVEGSND